jgi:carbon-monoxide dehydrogenase large subunit
MHVGRPHPRVEDGPALRGRATYLDDLDAGAALELVFVRSPHPHAAVRGLDVAEAARQPGVEMVIRPEDLDGVLDLVPDLDRPGAARIARPVLAGERARYVGEPVAAIVATDRYRGEDAAELVAIDYEPLPPVASIEDAEDPASEPLHEGGNVIFREQKEFGDVDAAFAEAAVVVERTFRSPRYSAAPMENRGVLAIPGADGLVVWSSTQIPHILEESIVEVLGLQEGSVRVRCPDIGGGFGQKAHVFPEEIVVAWAALRLGRPVKWVEDRVENLLSSTHAREQRVVARAAADAGGRLLALDVTIHSDVGAYGIYPWGQILEALGTPAIIPGPYTLPRYRYATHAVATNKCPQGAYRGVGLPVSVIVHERLIEVVAAELGLDPAEVRRRNFIAPDQFPYDTVSGLQYDSGDYRAALDRALEAIDYEGFPARQAAASAEGRRLGLGIACYVEWSGTNSATYRGRGMTRVRGYDAARLAVNADGTVSLWTSCPAIGQGVATTFSQLAAEHLGVGIDAIRIETLDTAEAPRGSGSFASRSAISAGGALTSVAQGLRRRLVETAAARLEANPDDVELVDGRLAVRGTPSASMSIAEAFAAAEPGHLDIGEPYDPPVTAYPYATHACEIEVDPETGDVRIARYVVAEDCGPMINPAIVDGQVHGATAQGIGGALHEAIRYGDDGQMLTASFMDYLVPTACDLPEMDVHHLQTPSPQIRNGFKGVGEGGTLAPPAALANAVGSALGIEINEFPISPERTLAALRGGEAR